MSAAETLSEDLCPKLPRGVKLTFDKTRDQWVLLAPERVISANGSAVEILKLCDGRRRLGDIIDALAETFQADRAVIARDTCALLAALREKRMVDL